MNNQLRFHIDSQKAYDVNKTSEQMRMDNFEAYVTGNNPAASKYANAYANVKRPDLGNDMVHGGNLDEIVSI